MKIVLASTSAIKIEACKKAFADVSGAEQPVGDETLAGAFRRIRAAREAVPDADLYVSIENGIFEEGGAFVDRAVVVMEKREGQSGVTYSDGVEFPRGSVEETARRGFNAWTVGKVMAEQGVVGKHDDPHLDLSGKSRVAYIDDAMREAVAALGRRPS